MRERHSAPLIPTMTEADEAGDAAAPGVPSTPTSAASNGGGSTKKRLLPKELRRRRRARLQITQEKSVATVSAKDIIESISDNHTLDAPVTESPRPDNGATEESSPGVVQEAVVSAPAQPALEPKNDKPALGDETSLAADTPGSAPKATTKKLHNLFSFSRLDRKRQKLQHRASLVDVPTYMKVDHVPLDLALKSKVVISMSFAFPFIRPRAASISAAAADQKSDVPEVRWLQALRYYVHPASSLPASLNATNERQLEESDFYVNRFRVWQESFRHAYHAFRRLPQNGTLYVRYPEFVVCFFIDEGSAKTSAIDQSIVGLCNTYQSGREVEDDQKARVNVRCLRAVISQSNARLRKELHRRGVVFNTPFNLRALQKPVTTQELNDTDLADHSVPSFGADQSVHGPDSLLHFSGHHGVHGLYEFLLNRKPLSNQDVPEIVACHPFTNAAIRSIAVRFMGNTSGRSVGDDAASSAQLSSIRSEVELSGCCFPSLVEKLMLCLEDSQKEEGSSAEVAIKAALETAPMSERLNAVFLDDKKMNVMGASRVGEEREAWKQQLEFAKRRLQSVKKSRSSIFEIEMSTR